MSKQFEKIVAEAEIAGRKAALECRPRPMIVGTPTTPFGNDTDITKPVYKVDDGACGFAWVHFAGNTAFGRWAKKAKIARADYPNGLCVWVREFGQSVERKKAYATAYAAILKSAGIECYADSRLD